MEAEQKKEIAEILSFVDNRRKKQTNDLLNLWINHSSKYPQKTASFSIARKKIYHFPLPSNKDLHIVFVDDLLR